MLRVVGFLVRVTILWGARAVFLAVALSPFAAGWVYFGYQRIACHPMFSSDGDGCDAFSAMAAQHATTAGKLVLPYQRLLTENTVEVVIVGVAVLLWAITVEMVFRFGLRR
jgi:hypothetical protein